MADKRGVQFEGKETYVKGVFGDIARFYDRWNNVITFGMVSGWQRFVVKQTCVKPGGSALDVGAGTGEIAFMLADTVGKDGRVVGLDLSCEMLEIARVKQKEKNLPIVIDFVEGSALELPFEDDSFDCTTSGFMLRNVTDIDCVIREMRRVVRPGGRVVCLEIAEPKNALFRWGFRIHFGKIVPAIGRLFDRGRSNAQQNPYIWLNRSFKGFPFGEDMAEIYRKAGLKEVVYYNKCLGSVNIYVGVK